MRRFIFVLQLTCTILLIMCIYQCAFNVSVIIKIVVLSSIQLNNFDSIVNNQYVVITFSILNTFNLCVFMLCLLGCFSVKYYMVFSSIFDAACDIYLVSFYCFNAFYLPFYNSHASFFQIYII